ncbi:MAG: pseudouridine synthase [Actinomycetota bacterium]
MSSKPRSQKTQSRAPKKSRSAPEAHETEGVRLQKVLASAGVASRRKAEDLIVEGRVSVNGRTVTKLGSRVDPESDRIKVDGQRISIRAGRAYLMLNKPAGYITTANDPLGRKSVIELVKARRRLFTVGRLDYDTTGLILLTDDGELAHRLSHPRYEIERVYLAQVEGAIGEPSVRRLKSGIMLEDGMAKAKRVKVRARGKRRSQVEIVLTEGRNREVRRMMDAVGHPILELARIGFGTLRLGRLRPGESRPLTSEEVGTLSQLVNL